MRSGSHATVLRGTVQRDDPHRRNCEYERVGWAEALRDKRVQYVLRYLPDRLVYVEMFGSMLLLENAAQSSIARPLDFSAHSEYLTSP